MRVARVSAAKWVRPALTALFLAVFVAAYLLSDASRGETNRAIRVLTSGGIEVVREYILSYGAWTPLISAALMALQAILAFLPSFILDFANGLPSAHSRADC